MTDQDTYELGPPIERTGGRQTLAGPASSIGMGSSGAGTGGPTWLDAGKTKRPPNPSELVNAFKAVAYACMKLNSNGVCRNRLKLYVTTGRNEARPRCEVGDLLPASTKYLRGFGYVQKDHGTNARIQEVVEHPILDALAEPNEFFDDGLFLQYLVECLDCIGSAYVFPARIDPTWSPIELWPLQAQYVFPVKGSGDRILDGYQFFGEQYGPDQVVRLRALSLRDPYLGGYAPMHACFEQLGIGDQYTAVMESILKCGARPSIILSPANSDRPLPTAERKRLEIDINQKTGPGAQGRVWVTDGAIKAETLTLPPVDLGGEGISKAARQTAANCFGVPMAMIDPSDANRAIAEAAIYSHQLDAVEPRCKAIARALSRGLARTVDPRLFLAFEDPVNRDKMTEAKTFEIWLRNDVMVPNEVRSELGLAPMKDGDKTSSQRKPAPQPVDADGKPGKKKPTDDGDDDE